MCVCVSCRLSGARLDACHNAMHVSAVAQCVSSILPHHAIVWVCAVLQATSHPSGVSQVPVLNTTQSVHWGLSLHPYICTHLALLMLAVHNARQAVTRLHGLEPCVKPFIWHACLSAVHVAERRCPGCLVLPCSCPARSVRSLTAPLRFAVRLRRAVSASSV